MRLTDLVVMAYSTGLLVVTVVDLLPLGLLDLACLLEHLCMAYNFRNVLCHLLCRFEQCIRLCADAALQKVEEVWLGLLLLLSHSLLASN